MNKPPRIGSLFSGAGGLDMAVEAVFGGQTVWHSEIDPAASKVLAHRWPGVPNLGDITKVDWADVPAVGILCGGFPCQDLSLAGKRQGLDGARSGLWYRMRDAIAALQPDTVIVENVLGLAASGAIGEVTSDLIQLRYGVAWSVVSAASVGAPHRRRRVFIVANKATQLECHRHDGESGAPKGVKLLPTPEAKNAHAGQDYARSDRPNSGGDDLVTAVIKGYPSRWREYAVAIGRWEHITGRAAPYPTEPTSTGNARINPAFAEWLMGWPAGWVTDVPGAQEALFGEPEPGVDRSDQLKLCGNGVVPRQAEAAIRALTTIKEKATA
jgi:DNA (cytosine-5)-methyltransferase 1